MRESSSLSWDTMKKIIIRYKDKSFKVSISEDNTSIIDSYKVKSIRDMKGILSEIRSEADSSMAVNNRSIFSMINEWRVHNLLYTFNIQRNRTKSVDLDTRQPWYMRITYTVLSPFYLHFF